MNINTNCDISFIIPAYNVEPYLAACIDSIRKLSVLNWEIILINDGSTDCTGEIADQYAQNDNRIRVYHQENKGVSNARNRALGLARGKYISFIDSDDWLTGDRIVAMYDEAIHSQADMVMGNIIFYYTEEYTANPLNPVPENLVGKTMKGTSCFTELMKNFSFSSMACGYIYNRKWLLSTGLRFEDILHEDELWCFNSLCLARRAVVTDIDFYGYRQREGSIMHTLNNERRVKDLIFIASKLIAFASRYTFAAENQRELYSQIYVKIYWLYNVAFSTLAKVKNSRFVLPPHHLYSLFKFGRKLTPEAKKQCLYFYRISQKGLREYLCWRMSYWATLSTSDLSSKKIILVYNTLFNEPLDIPIREIPADCILTTDRACFYKADAVVFHMPTLINELEDDLKKPDNQKWVAWSLESEANYPFMEDPEVTELFDYKMSYHQNSDIIYPYYEYEYKHQLLKEPEVTFAQKRDICMLISSPFNKSKRQEYLKQLMNCIDIDSYGSLFNNKKLELDSGRSTKMELYKTYKFIISFENSCTIDYVTEKFYDPLLAGSVPVYLGAPNIKEFSPGRDSFINVRDFESPEVLAAYLHKLCKDEQYYNRFLKWKKKPLPVSFQQKLDEQKIHPFIRLCKLIAKKNDKKQLGV